jgi:predicted ester cyclase
MLHHDATATKARLLDAFRAIAGARPEATASLVDAVFAPDVKFFANHPLNDLVGSAAVSAKIWQPLQVSFRDLRRNDDIFAGGSFQGADWLMATGYLHGTFVDDYLGVPATGNWAYLRYGEFHKLVDGRIVQSHVIYDLPDLMRQAGVAPWRPGRGVETLMPGPATRDGIVLGEQAPEEGRLTLEIVEAMIFEGLLTYDGQDSEAMGMEKYWTPDMMWYGPGMIGAMMGLDRFMELHQEPWQNSMLPRGPMPTREDKHVTRFAEGKFCGFTGWPSIYATHGGEFLGLPATGLPVEIRVMDFYHRAGDRLNENWIFIDMPHLFLQLGVDLFALMRQKAGR